MPVSLKSTGGGSVTLDVPATGSTFTLTLPAATGTVATTTGTLTNPTINGFTGDTSVINVGSGQFYKDTSGNVGIGTTSPFSKLSVAGGTLSVAGSTSGSGVVKLGDPTDPTPYVGMYRAAAAAIATSGNFLNLGGYDGIAFTTGQTQFSGQSERARIDSSGNLLVGKTSQNAALVGAEMVPTGQIRSTTSTSTNADLSYTLYSTGAGAYRFYVGLGGTIYATSTTITSISDQRLKENIQDIDVGLDAILSLKPRKFDWKSGKGKDKKGDRGWIAQEFEQVFPDMIDTWADPAPEGEEPYKAVNADLIPVLVKAIQELKADLDAAKAEIATLKGAA
jgi:hypothetical protein